MIIDATKVNEVIRNEVRLYSDMVKMGGKKLSLLIINASDEESNNRYINTKKKACEDVGIECVITHFESDVDAETIKDYIKENQWNYTGVMIQDPVYSHLDHDDLMTAVDPIKDVDGLHPLNQGLLYERSPKGLRPCTAAGVVRILRFNDVQIKNSTIVIFGRGKLVGDPLAKMLENLGATVTKVHTDTPDLEKRRFIHDANIIISCTGRDMSEFINPNTATLKLVAVVGVGFRYENGKQLQDFDVNDLWPRHIKITSNTKSTGLATVASLLYNIILADTL